MALNLPLDDLHRRIGALVLETWAQDAEIQRLQRQVQMLQPVSGVAGTVVSEPKGEANGG
ncbi:MAG: hypothetical protein M0R75_15520 [Dehalococcoidia bacterium]|nr:hypothetical protein [Dehalococcoidia bacterium]